MKQDITRKKQQKQNLVLSPASEYFWCSEIDYHRKKNLCTEKKEKNPKNRKSKSLQVDRNIDKKHLCTEERKIKKIEEKKTQNIEIKIFTQE